MFSFSGFCVSAVFKTLRERRPVFPGLLLGPFIPVYGFGGITVAILNSLLPGLYFFPFLVAATIAASVIEYLNL